MPPQQPKTTQATERRTVQLGDVDNNGSIGCEDLNLVGDALLGRKLTIDQVTRADTDRDGTIKRSDYLEYTNQLICQRVTGGDINGDNRIDCNDINIMMDFILERLRPTQAHLARADFNKDNAISVNDVLLLSDMYPLSHCKLS